MAGHNHSNLPARDASLSAYAHVHVYVHVHVHIRGAPEGQDEKMHSTSLLIATYKPGQKGCACCEE